MSEAGFEEILRRLGQADVRFVLIGGLALGSWGVIRATKDVDIVIDREPANVRALAEVTVALDGRIQSSEAFMSSAFSIAAALAQDDRRVLIDTPRGPLDVVAGLPGVPPYQELISRAQEAEIAGVKIWVCSREDLRAMKEAAGRPQDLVDLASLASIEDDQA